MKLRLLALSLFISLISCSGDDSSEQAVSDKNLLKVISVNDYYKFHYEFSENKIRKIYQYNLNDELVEAYEYHYSPNGVLNSIIYLDDMLLPTGVHTEFYYDNQGRMIKDALKAVNQDGDEVEDYYEFIYNNNSTITVNKVYAFAETDTKTYYLNNEGIVYKISEELSGNLQEEEVIYNDSCIISQIFNNTTLNFIYDDTVVKGHYLKSGLNMFNGDILNHQLFAKGFANKSYTKYMLGIEQPSANIDIVYQFDEDGYPIKKSMYTDTTLLSEEIIIYQ